MLEFMKGQFKHRACGFLLDYIEACRTKPGLTADLTVQINSNNPRAMVQRKKKKNFKCLPEVSKRSQVFHFI